VRLALTSNQLIEHTRTMQGQGYAIQSVIRQFGTDKYVCFVELEQFYQHLSRFNAYISRKSIHAPWLPGLPDDRVPASLIVTKCDSP
jgi:hypothetical protein